MIINFIKLIKRNNQSSNVCKFLAEFYIEHNSNEILKTYLGASYNASFSAFMLKKKNNFMNL